MKIKILTASNDLEDFRHLTKKYIDVLLPIEYLKRSKVVSFCHQGGAMCGGFVLVKNEPLRVLESIPANYFAQIPIDLSNVAEITGLWLDSKKADNIFCSILFWLALYYNLSSSSFDGFVYAYALKKKNLRRIYATFCPVTLFEGLTKQLEGMASPEKEAVEFITKRKVRLAPFQHFKFFSRRFTLILKTFKRYVVRA